MPSRKTSHAREGFFHEFSIPCEWWSGTDTLQTEVMRARRRHWVREYAKKEWRMLKKQGAAWHVDRYVAIVGVAYPRHTGFTVPSRAAETVKPIIDGGTDAKLWDDDDATHRCGTLYFQLPKSAPDTKYLLQITIFPVPSKMPSYQLTGGVGGQITRLWKEEAGRPDGWGGFRVRFTVPDRLWITSNLTDSDIMARQHGARKSTFWGNGRSIGIRKRISSELSKLMLSQWLDQSDAYWGVDRFIILAGVSYAHGVSPDQADPDNATETINAILQAGVAAHAWHGVSARHCRAVGSYRSPSHALPGTHSIEILALPVPDSFHVMTAVGESSMMAWAEHDRRRA